MVRKVGAVLFGVVLMLGVLVGLPTDPVAAAGGGETWTAHTPAEDTQWRSVTYGVGLFVAVATHGTNQVMTSPDGATWTARSVPGDDAWSSVTYGNGLFVAVSGTGSVMTSPDGIVWTARSAAEPNNAWVSVTYGDGLFVAVANTPNRLMTSPDGIVWTLRADPIAHPWTSVTYGNGQFVAVGFYTSVMTSPDGVTWTARTAPEGLFWTSVTYGNGLFVAVAGGGTNQVMTSPDGIVWTARSAAEASAWVSVTYGNGLFVAVSEDGTNRVMTSPDGVTWTARSAPGDDLWSSVTYGNGLFVAVSSYGSVMRSRALESAVYVPVTPCRVVDTRQAGGSLGNREIRSYQVAGTGSAFASQGGKTGGCGIPEGAVAVEASVTAVSPTTSGFFRAWPFGASMPNATFMNFARNQDITNTGTIPLATAAGQNLTIRNFGGNAQYVIDIQGYFTIGGAAGAPASGVDGAQTQNGATGSTYVSVTPCRVVDTRQAGGALGNREIRSYQVAGTGSAFASQGGNPGGCGIPEGAVAVEASVTAVSPTTSGFFRAWPFGASMPNATFMNFARNQDITNTGTIPLATAAGQNLTIRNFGGNAQYVIDIQGYFTNDAAGAEPNEASEGDEAEGAVVNALDGSTYVSVTPCRVVDTRQAGGSFGNREIRSYQVAGTGITFAAQGGKTDGCDVPEGAVAVEASVTAVSPTTSGFFRAWPFATSMPNATFMNFARNQDITNTGTIPLATAAGQNLTIRNFGGNGQYVIDIQGYYTTAI